MKVIYSQKAIKSLKKLDKPIQKLIVSYMDQIGSLKEPRARGKALSANLKGFWRYRVGDIRIICEIVDMELVIAVIDIGHRRSIYDNK